LYTHTFPYPSHHAQHYAHCRPPLQRSKARPRCKDARRRQATGARHHRQNRAHNDMGSLIDRFDFPRLRLTMLFPNSHHPTAVCANHSGGAMTTVGDGGLGVTLSLSPSSPGIGSAAPAAAQKPGTTPPGQALKTAHPLAGPTLPQTQLTDRWLARDNQGSSFASHVPSVAAPVCIDARTSMRRSSSLQTDRDNEGSGNDDDECKVTRESEETRTGHGQVQQATATAMITANVAGRSKMSLHPHKKRDTDR